MRKKPSENIMGKGENAGFSNNVFTHERLYSSLNPFENNPWFLQVCSTSLLKTQWEKEKLLVTSNFSFFHSVFYLFGELSAFFIEFEIIICKLFQFGRVKNLSFGKGLQYLFYFVCAFILHKSLF